MAAGGHGLHSLILRGKLLKSGCMPAQKLKLAPKDSDSLYVTGTNGQRHLLQVGTEDGSTVPRISVTGVFGRYDGVGVDTQVAFHNGDPETAGKRLTAALTQSPDALAPAFSHLGRVRFIVKASDFGHPIQPVGMSSLAGLESNAKQIFPAISDIPATTPPADACRYTPSL